MCWFPIPIEIRVCGFFISNFEGNTKSCVVWFILPLLQFFRTREGSWGRSIAPTSGTRLESRTWRVCSPNMEMMCELKCEQVVNTHRQLIFSPLELIWSIGIDDWWPKCLFVCVSCCNWLGNLEVISEQCWDYCHNRWIMTAIVRWASKKNIGRVVCVKDRLSVAVGKR